MPDPSEERMAATESDSMPRVWASLFTSACVPPPGATTSELVLPLVLLLRVGGILRVVCMLVRSVLLFVLVVVQACD